MLQRLTLGFAVLLPLAEPANAATGVVYQTSVVPEEAEDMASACRYEITLLDPSRAVRGVWVIFDRGRDMLRYYGDPDVQAFAQRNDFALMLPFHCEAKTGGDMDVDPSKGLGRALLAALTQFARLSAHPELASTKVILLGFSGTGSLVGRFPAYAPDRTLAVIAGDPGHFEPLGVDTINLDAQASAIPQLILAGSADAVSGTERPYAYFRRHFDRGAPWTFVIQNNTPHCCIINAKSLVLDWLEAVVIERTSTTGGFHGFIKTSESTTGDCPSPSPPASPIWCRGTKDSWGGANWLVSVAKIDARPESPVGMIPAGWLPTRHFAEAWRSFVTAPEHPVTSLP